jgi:hypothetical protein
MATPRGNTPGHALNASNRTQTAKDILINLGLTSYVTFKKMLLSESFLDPWSFFRDTLPLNPHHASKFRSIPDTTKFVDETVSEVYNSMDSMFTCKWDKPSDRKGWTFRDYLSCFVYHAARNFACPGQIFGDVFDRKNVKNQGGRAVAMKKIKGLVMLALVLTYAYSGDDPPPDGVVECIEAARPTANPENSPIKSIRRRYALEKMDVSALREIAVAY